ncbi:adenylate/guanylate cyclase domain-containing protein [Rhodobacter sp. Har01]|uniref:adenylate/guanylate cyclase domain-containing protein n=1 Tax=Rhodobacter sp. Har01 TaxID=2883999 RepID=UPI001D07BA3F|nr:adenylate/guanylate cyclase domain-containing protein [Rhodobacter sp. Har01]MCB6177792.1 adenylate/guanylate cyclase domain-containing protein [Rhodobacter sp. Har01]
MTKPPRRWRRVQAGLVALALCLAGAAGLAWRPAVLAAAQERVFDALLRPGAGGAVVVVDIGAVDQAGQPWDRAASARLAEALALAGPKVVAWDVVFAGGCDGAATTALAAAVAKSPTVLGFLLSGAAGPAPQPPPVLAVSAPALTRLWAAPAAEVPCPALMAAATLGSVSLPGDGTARVRSVPAAVTVGGVAWPSLPIEALRRAGALEMPVIAAEDGRKGMTLRAGAATFPLDLAGTLRFVPRDTAARLARTVPAEAVLAGRVPPERLAGAVVFVGSSLPQRGGLRPVAGDPLYPSVQIAADLAEGLLAGRLPWRPGWAVWAEAAGLALGGLLLALALARLAPLRAFATALGLGAVWAGGAVAAQRATGALVDPAVPAAALVGAALLALVVQAAASARAERALRARMGQLLPGPVVARLADDPRLLRLAGERREVTALFTDLEGFSTLVASLPPEQLIATLDRYFAAVTAAVLRHGGMIDKIVGDAVHALFNAPLDQPGHVDAALAAAFEISAATESLRPALGLGRTRIGVETGPAILGDVGGGARIDYTAHGPAVNLAARLQEAGKVLGPDVIIGPAAAAAARRPLRPLGEAEVRSFGRMQLFTLP